MKKIIAITIILLCSLVAFAETQENRKENPHEIRIGIAECLSAWTSQTPGYLSDVQFDKGYVLTENGIYSHFYTGFLFAEYQYRVNKWFGIGANLTILGMGNTEFYREKCQIEDYYTEKRNYGAMIYLMPVARFTYLNKKNISLYGSLGFAPGIDIYKNKCSFTWAVDFTYFGMSIGKGHWFGDIELGGAIPLFFTKMLRVGVGYRF
jgi:opacity protein-like surface antigen